MGSPRPESPRGSSETLSSSSLFRPSHPLGTSAQLADSVVCVTLGSKYSRLPRISEAADVLDHQTQTERAASATARRGRCGRIKS